MNNMQDFDSLQIRLASPEKIRSWSYGEVKKPETINYRTLRPEKEGLFCERIFGTTKEWECYCGKFKSPRYKGLICDRCGVEITHSRVRRERMGHVELASPVSHIWYYRAVPSSIGSLLDLTQGNLRAVLYYEKYIVIKEGATDLKRNQLLSEEEFIEAKERYGVEDFEVGIGAEAIARMLDNLDLDALAAELRAKMIEKGIKADKRLLKRVEIVENFRRSGNLTNWMILNVVPIIPPDLRPMVQLDGGRFATSDLNDLYRRVINRNNRLRRLIALSAPDVIIRNERRMLQEAVDALLDNSRRKKAVKGASNRPLKSLSDLLKGKQGRFRQNLLGKRVDYSGRSVIVVGPQLKLHQCGLPVQMAMELYKPFIMRKLVERGIVFNIKKAKMSVEQGSEPVWEILDEVVREHPVLLNRAPTLHRLGIQAFEPIPVEGKAIQLHPLVCHAFNADFDGDQMAVHVPLTLDAQVECWSLMLSSKNLMNPANGQPIVFPTQDMVLGVYHLTKEHRGCIGEGKYFASSNEVIQALEADVVDHHSIINYRYQGNWLETTPGRVLLNEALPDKIEYVNYTLNDKAIRNLIEMTFRHHRTSVTVELLDTLKSVGFRYATLLGCTIGIDDIIIPKEKKGMIEKANKEVSQIQKQYQAGHITNEERYNRVVEVWSNTNDDLTQVLMERLEKDKDGFNSIYLMADSGARGSHGQIRQLAGMRGLMAKPSGDIIELPIRSNFKEGLSVIEFFISTNGARKGLADTALKTADAGYLTRRLVDIAQDVVVNDEDCGTINGIDIAALKDGEEIVERLSDRIRGSFTLERVLHPITAELLINVDQEISDDLAEQIEEIGVESVRLRTVLTCEAKHGVCRKCYGRDLPSRQTVNIGEAVGIIAAQSIGQPGTQLTMRTFHVGGTASTIAEDNRVSLRYDVVVCDIRGNYLELDNGNLLFTRKGSIQVARVLKKIKLLPSDKLLIKDGDKVLRELPIIQRGEEQIAAGEIAFARQQNNNTLLLITQEQRLDIRNGATVMCQINQLIEAEKPLAIFDPFSDPIIAEVSGKIEFNDIDPATTLREEINEDTGNIEKKISEDYPDYLEPRIKILDPKGVELATYLLPVNAYLNVENGMQVKAGRTLAKMLKESTKTQDITGGLPRVVELFEARQPHNAAVLSKVTGTVHFKQIVKAKRLIVVEDMFGRVFKHFIPTGRLLLVRDGDPIEVAEPLCDGPVNPHSILDIQGENALQRFLVDEVQEVYRMQGVEINDKHIGVIIRQMLRKVQVLQVGDTCFIYGQQVDKFSFLRENERVVNEGGQPAVAGPLLQGITRASLNIDSWISAASFQETTKVLTNAAIAGDTDVLRGLKENVVIGHIIPAGTGMKSYRSVKLYNEDNEDLDDHVHKVLEQRRREKELARQQISFEEDDVEELAEEEDGLSLDDFFNNEQEDENGTNIEIDLEDKPKEASVTVSNDDANEKNGEGDEAAVALSDNDDEQS